MDTASVMPPWAAPPFFPSRNGLPVNLRLAFRLEEVVEYSYWHEMIFPNLLGKSK
jgi:hypothetical protein